jgi:DNA-binding XRE family transcriptional regulator
LPFCRVTLKARRPQSPAYPKKIKTLGDHLRKRRLDLALLQRQVADSIGVDKNTIANWEGQRSNPALILMPAIIRFLGYNPLPGSTTLAGRLVRYRTSLGMTQKALAKRLGIDPCTLARWEREEKMPIGLYRQLVEDLLSLWLTD